MTQRIALVVTSHGRFEESGRLTGLWLPAFARLYDLCRKTGIEPVVASVGGGRVPLDPSSQPGVPVIPWWPQRGGDTLARLERTPTVSSLDLDSLDGLHLAGGHGAAFDFPNCRPLALLVRGAMERGLPVSSVCHGPSGLLGATSSAGEPLVAGRRVTCLSWREEGLLGFRHEMPFNLESELAARGAEVLPTPLPFGPRVVVDGNLITGANPASSFGAARALVRQVLARR